MTDSGQGSAGSRESTKEIELALRHGDLALVRVYVRRLRQRGAPVERLYKVAAARVPRAPGLETLMEAPPNVVPMLRPQPSAGSVPMRLAPLPPV